MVPIDFEHPIPLFPLPNCVLFPGVLQPLHVFEERYRQMVADTLEDQSAIAMALLRPGWEKDYYGKAAIHRVVCAGKIVAHEKLEDGKYNLLLQGVARAEVIGERREKLYRVATLRPLAEATLAPDTDTEATQRETIRGLFEAGPLAELSVAKSVHELLGEGIRTAALVDMLAFAMVQDMPTRQRLLEELDAVKRAEVLLDHLTTLTRLLAGHGGVRTGGTWPPTASKN